jgi:hypothetical protein
VASRKPVPAPPRSPRPTQRATPPRPGEPEVLLDVECVDERLYLVLVNVGPATAFQVRVAFRRPLIGVGGEVVVSDQRVFRLLPMLRPAQEIRVFIDTRSALLKRRQAKIVQATVTYRARGGRRLSEVFRHDLRMWDDWGAVR